MFDNADPLLTVAQAPKFEAQVNIPGSKRFMPENEFAVYSVVQDFDYPTDYMTAHVRYMVCDPDIINESATPGYSGEKMAVVQASIRGLDLPEPDLDDPLASDALNAYLLQHPAQTYTDISEEALMSLYDSYHAGRRIIHVRPMNVEDLDEVYALVETIIDIS